MVKITKVDDSRYAASVDGVEIAFAVVRANYICGLFVKKEYRRQGIGISLVRFISEDRKKKLNRAPSWIKNEAIRQMSAKLADELLEEAKL